MNLDAVREGERVALDANILVYANQGKSASCIALLERCADGGVTGVVPMPMVLELMHTLMLMDWPSQFFLNVLALEACFEHAVGHELFGKLHVGGRHGSLSN